MTATKKAKKPKTMKIPALKCVQHGRVFYNISLTPSLLNFLKKKPNIKRYNPGDDGTKCEGYQRNQDDGKTDQIGKYVSDKNNMMVDPVNLNMPSESADLVFEPSANNPTLGYLIVPENAILNIYDGGHRYLGTEKAWELSSDIDFDLPATLTNAPEQDEILLFCLKNITADRIPSDLLVDLKVKLNGHLSEVNGEKRYLPSKMTRDMNWLPTGREIARLLNTERLAEFGGNPWFAKMRLANGRGEKLPNVHQWFKLGKFAEYLRPVAMNSFKLLPESTEERAIVVCNMWKAVKQLVPDAFSANATNYRLATGHVSIEPLHRLLNSFVLYHLCKGKFANYATFQDAADAVNGQIVIPTVDEFVEILNKCRVKPVDNPTANGKKLFTGTHWLNDGPSRHYHGKGNVSILINEVNNSLNIPPMKNSPQDVAA